MCIAKNFLDKRRKKQPFFYMSSNLKQIFASRNFLGVERYVFLFDTLVGPNFFQGWKKNFMTPLAPKVFDPPLAIPAVPTYDCDGIFGYQPES